jgi:excisionase family DNA binding protein
MSEVSWLTTGEVSQQLGVSRVYVHQLLREGRLQGRLRGNTWLIDPESLRQFEATRKPKSGRKQQPAH